MIEVNTKLPLLDHPHDAPTVFRPEDLVQAVRVQKGLLSAKLPDVCVLDFDGDLTDALVKTGNARPCESWACFHTRMWTLDVAGHPCGIIARTIGGPYAVLVAEQLAVSGVRVIVGLTSAGRVGTALPVPGIVVADRAIRDEGTSFHYLPAGDRVDGPAEVADAMEYHCATVGLPVRRGLVWTTDAPYRETAAQIERYAAMGALAVEMQAASLFAFAAARKVAVGIVAHVTNAPDHDGEPFDKGAYDVQNALFHAVCRGGLGLLGSRLDTAG